MRKGIIAVTTVVIMADTRGVTTLIGKDARILTRGLEAVTGMGIPISMGIIPGLDPMAIHMAIHIGMGIGIGGSSNGEETRV